MPTAFGENGAYGVDAERDRPLSLREIKEKRNSRGEKRGMRLWTLRAQVGGLDTPCRFYIALPCDSPSFWRRGGVSVSDTSSVGRCIIRFIDFSNQ